MEVVVSEFYTRRGIDSLGSWLSGVLVVDEPQNSAPGEEVIPRKALTGEYPTLSAPAE